MPQAKTSKKKSTAKVGGGGVGTRVSKLNLKIVIPIVVVVAALGGFYIFRKSSAGSAAVLTGGGGTVTKNDGVTYRLSGPYGTVRTWGGGSWLITGHNKVCAKIRPISSKYPWWNMTITVDWWTTEGNTKLATSSNTSGIPANTATEVCATKPDTAEIRARGSSGISYHASVSGPAVKDEFGVSSIYSR